MATPFDITLPRGIDLVVEPRGDRVLFWLDDRRAPERTAGAQIARSLSSEEAASAEAVQRILAELAAEGWRRHDDRTRFRDGTRRAERLAGWLERRIRVRRG